MAEGRRGPVHAKAGRHLEGDLVSVVSVGTEQRHPRGRGHVTGRRWGAFVGAKREEEAAGTL